MIHTPKLSTAALRKIEKAFPNLIFKDSSWHNDEADSITIEGTEIQIYLHPEWHSIWDASDQERFDESAQYDIEGIIKGIEELIDLPNYVIYVFKNGERSPYGVERYVKTKALTQSYTECISLMESEEIDGFEFKQIGR